MLDFNFGDQNRIHYHTIFVLPNFFVIIIFFFHDLLCQLILFQNYLSTLINHFVNVD